MHIYMRVGKAEQLNNKKRGNDLNTLIYVRGGNVPKQLRECREYAIKNNLTIVSRTTIWGEAEKVILTNDIKVLLIHSPCRISRNREIYENIKSMLNTLGIEIKIVEQG